jgi:hypothetical protein
LWWKIDPQTLYDGVLFEIHSSILQLELIATDTLSCSDNEILFLSTKKSPGLNVSVFSGKISTLHIFRGMSPYQNFPLISIIGAGFLVLFMRDYF